MKSPEPQVHQSDEQHRRIYIYCRISDEDQSTYSLDGQERDCRRLAEANGWRVTRVYTDKESGASLERPQIQHLLKILRPGDAVIVWRLDRLSRDSIDMRTTIDAWADRNIQVISINDSWLDIANHTGREMATIMGAIGSMERQKIRERARAGMAEKAMQGLWPGSTPPYGYGLQDGMLFTIEERAWVVRRIYEWYLYEGQGVESIAGRLNGMCVANPQLNEEPFQAIPSPMGGTWSETTVRKLLDNEVYKGTLVWGERGTGAQYRTKRATPELVIRKEGVFPAIIVPVMWDAVHDRRMERAALAPRSLEPSPYYLTGRLRCGACGSAMGGETRKGRVYYRCCGRRMGVTCQMPMVRGDELHAAWLAEMTARLDPERVREAIAAELNQADPSSGRREWITARLAELDRAESSWDRKAEKELISDEVWDEKTRPIKAERVTLKDEMDRLGAPRPRPSVEHITASAAAIITAWEVADNSQRKELVRASCSQLIVTPERFLHIAI